MRSGDRTESMSAEYSGPSDERRDLAAAGTGDESAFGRLASRHRAGIELYCGLMLGCPEKAHDAAGEALLRGWTDLHSGAAPAAARIWLYRLATDVCLELLEATDESVGPTAFDVSKDRNGPPK